ncbi:phosphate ABC transporter membrane protein 2, PhoT family [Actinokineospora alba]|uniref:Phosphate transport system permease protein PstA n=1 Tax=Actinokineospora alba TaxID=504798 RepID=A0A1H0PMX8_9PSEU|nr:phosphate ABC transporter membrane protein 2 (PhoT family) [Actinokineospora alba]SDI63615.1 phosphate transport system permease protein [Actinokineospora alba]SDP06005.1 phosphate ABC transporter membrane protein 2, PhoT family [Actinokineospora alba]
MMTTATSLDRPAKAPAFQQLSTGRKLKNQAATILVGSTFVLALAPLVWLLFTVISKGFQHVLTADWWQKSLAGLTSRQFGGGVYHAILGTLLQGLICAVIAVPIAIMVAVYLVEYGKNSRLARAVTFTVDILSGVPSIVAALFIYALWITTMGMPRSAFAVSLALVLLMIPVVVRTTEELLKIVPDELREASYALGIPKWKTIVKIVIPTAMSGIITGISLAIARVMGETAPVLVLVGYTTFINYDPFGGSMSSLPLLMTSERLTTNEVGEARVWGAAVTLILIITVFNLLGSLISRLTSLKTK